MTHLMDKGDTIAYLRSRKMTEIEACNQWLQAGDTADRPGGVGIDAVRSAAVTSYEALQDTDQDTREIGSVDCPCKVLGADDCMRNPTEETQ